MNSNIYGYLKIRSVFVFVYLTEYKIRIWIYPIILSIIKLRSWMVTIIFRAKNMGWGREVERDGLLVTAIQREYTRIT